MYVRRIICYFLILFSLVGNIAHVDVQLSFFTHRHMYVRRIILLILRTQVYNSLFSIIDNMSIHRYLSPFVILLFFMNTNFSCACFIIICLVYTPLVETRVGLFATNYHKTNSRQKLLLHEKVFYKFTQQLNSNDLNNLYVIKNTTYSFAGVYSTSYSIWFSIFLYSISSLLYTFSLV